MKDIRHYTLLCVLVMLCGAAVPVWGQQAPVLPSRAASVGEMEGLRQSGLSSRAMSVGDSETGSGARSAATVAGDYAIRRGDVIQVVVFNEPELTVSGRVRKNGTIQCPLVGEIHIEGMTQAAAARAVEAAYRADYLVKPEVNLFVSTFTAQRVTVLGQVQRPGAYDVPPEGKLTILQVLGLAGGPTRVANISRVLVKRVLDSGRETTLKIDVAKMSSGQDTMLFYIQEGDVITVPESLF